MTKLAIFITFLFLAKIAFSTEYRCTLDLSKDGTEITKNDIKEYIKIFQFDNTKKKVGSKTTLKDINAMVWVKNGMTIAMIKDLKRKIAITSKYDLKQELIYLKLSPSTELICMTAKAWNKNQSPLLQNLYIPKVEKSSNLGELQHNVFFKIKKEIIFNYMQSGSNDKMRIIFFQDGKVIRDSYQKDDSKPWCAFQVEIKLDEDTYIYPGTILPPSKVKLLTSGTDNAVVSYSFIDFGTGKRIFHTSRFTPFSLECKINKKKALTYERFQQISGNYFELVTKDE